MGSHPLSTIERDFPRVRDGYDPTEVDHHLSLVAGWFRGGGLRAHAARLEERLAEREAAVAEREAAFEAAATAAAGEAERIVEGARIEAEATVEGAALRARSMLEEARLAAEATEALATARAEAARLVDTAQAEAAGIVEAATAEARRVRQAQLDGAGMEVAAHRRLLMQQAEDEVAAYAERRHREADRLVESARREDRTRGRRS